MREKYISVSDLLTVIDGMKKRENENCARFNDLNPAFRDIRNRDNALCLSALNELFRRAKERARDI